MFDNHISVGLTKKTNNSIELKFLAIGHQGI